MADQTWEDIQAGRPEFGDSIKARLETIRARITRARCERLLTQGQAAALLGMHRPCLSLLESGKQRLTVEILLIMAVIYGVAPAWLLGSDLDVTWSHTILDGEMIQLRKLGE